MGQQPVSRSSIEPDEGEYLVNGWEPDVPDSDTLVRRAVAVHASWGVAVAESLGRPARRTDRWAGGFVGERGALTNPVVVTAPVAPEDYPDLVGEAPPLKPGVELVAVAGEGALAVAERVLVEGYPMPDLQPVVRGSILSPALLDGTTRVWVAHVDGEPAAVAAAHVASGAVLVEYVAALASARGRGAGAAATWAATTCEPELPAVLISSDDGRPLYEAMGFVPIERWTVWIRPGR